jgi:hypothetical protein
VLVAGGHVRDKAPRLLPQRQLVWAEAERIGHERTTGSPSGSHRASRPTWTWQSTIEVIVSHGTID